MVWAVFIGGTATKVFAWTFEVKDLDLETDAVWMFEREIGVLLMGDGLKRLGRESARVSRVLRRLKLFDLSSLDMEICIFWV